ncbi:hypothetical protein AM228_13310 [Planktothricoides sp. SR001]|uniref:hypothetical protein n=1 Tax=Planktothricoides sp. SR001 TaxID=1705388 RepID=UPI0006C49502|nr:hypothetical protein [Planktothricoides sp. SR001]KOR36354.1 hypothetical protein AM228_13310 [Planktothricoides sp. SR001]
MVLKATTTSVYFMLYPKLDLAKVLVDKPELLKEVWQALNHISDEALMIQWRVYRGGLHTYWHIYKIIFFM